MTWNFGLDFGSALGGFVGMLGANASTRKQYKYQSRLQEQAARLNYEYGLKSLENGPTSQRTGLQNAGYNPMLAVQNATSGANSGWTTTGQMSAPDYSQSFSNALDLKRLENETAQTNSVVGLQGQQAETEAAKRKNLEFQNAMLDVEKHLKQKDLDTYDQRFYTEMYQMMQNAEKLRQEASVVGYNAETSRIVANAQQESAAAATTNAETNKNWTPAKIVGGIGAGLLGAVGIGKIGQVAKGAKWFKYGRKHINDWKTIYNGL